MNDPTEQTQPDAFEYFRDCDGNVLLVKEVNPGDPLGREVLGLLERPETPLKAEEYSCPLTTWARRWRDRTPPTPPSEWTKPGGN